MGKKIPYTIVCWILAVIIVIVMLPSVRLVFQKPVDILDAMEDPKAGTPVSVGVDGVVDWFATLEHQRNGITTSTEYYCIVWLDDSKFISMAVRESDKGTIDDIIDATWEYVDGNSYVLPDKVEFVGTLAKMQDEEQDYFEEYMLAMEYTRDEIPEYAYLWTIDTTNTKSMGTMALGIAGILFAVGLVFLIMAIKDKKAESMAVSRPASNAYGQANMYGTADAYNTADTYNTPDMNSSGYNYYDPRNYTDDQSQGGYYNAGGTDNSGTGYTDGNNQ